MSDFDPFGDAQPTRAQEREGHDAAAGNDGFDPWGDAPADPAAATRRGLELPRDAPGLGSMWDGTDAGQETGPEGGGGPRRGGRILVVCTGNVCRSPYIHLRLAHDLADLDIDVESAGTGALVGHPVDPGSAALLDAAGVPWSEFRARQLTAPMVEQADLVLTATRGHRRRVVQEAPAALQRTFALIDFADLVERVDERDVRGSSGRNGVARLVTAAIERRAKVAVRHDGEDVDDPFRLGTRAFVLMQEQLRAPLATVTHAIRDSQTGDRHISQSSDTSKVT